MSLRFGDQSAPRNVRAGIALPPLVAAGARVVAVELHTGRVEGLRRRFADDPVTVVCADARSLRLPRRPFRVVASPPYTGSTAILRRLLAPGSRMQSAYVVLQRPLVARWSGGRAPGSGRWLREYAVSRGRNLPRSAFVPPPKVDSAVLIVRRRGI